MMDGIARTADGVVRALLFAAGESRRMGEPKQLLPWCGRPLLVYQIEQLRAAGAVDVVVVLGHEAARLTPLVEAAGGRAVENKEYRSGRASSVRAGARALPDETDAVITLNVDQPRGAELIRRVLEGHRDGRAGVDAAAEGEHEVRGGRKAWSGHEAHPRQGGALITTPAVGGRRGHPVVFAGSLLPELRAVDEATEGLRAVVRRHAARRQILPVDDPAIHLEFNTPDEYAAARGGC